jgi:hypothetical protein
MVAQQVCPFYRKRELKSVFCAVYVLRPSSKTCALQAKINWSVKLKKIQVQYGAELRK